MTNKTLLKTGLMLSVALVLSTAQSFAQTETFDESPDFNLGPDTGTTIPGASTMVSITSFDTTLGTLNEVDLSLIGVQVSGTVSITNDSPINSETYTGVQLNGVYSVTDNVNTPVSLTISTTPVDSGTPTAPGDTYTTPPATSAVAPTQTETYTTLAGDDLTPYETVGSGNINLTLESNNSYTVTAHGGPAAETIDSSGTGYIEVTYDYTPVPEPAQTSAYLMGFGVLLLVGRMYLKNKRSLTV